MKVRFLRICSAIFLSSMLASVVSAAPYNQYQDPIKERCIAAYVWLYGEALAGNEVARRNLKVLERIYGPALSDLSKRAATEWQGQLIDHHLSLKYGAEGFSSEVVIAGADIGKVMEEWGYYPSRSTMRVVLEKWVEKRGVVSPTVKYSLTSFGLTQQPVTYLVSAWTLGSSEKDEPLVRGAGTSARIAGRYP